MNHCLNETAGGGEGREAAEDHRIEPCHWDAERRNLTSLQPLPLGRGGPSAADHIYIYIYICMYVCMCIYKHIVGCMFVASGGFLGHLGGVLGASGSSLGASWAPAGGPCGHPRGEGPEGRVSLLVLGPHWVPLGQSRSDLGGPRAVLDAVKTEKANMLQTCVFLQRMEDVS